jgi:hypothetical protein
MSSHFDFYLCTICLAKSQKFSYKKGQTAYAWVAACQNVECFNKLISNNFIFFQKIYISKLLFYLFNKRNRKPTKNEEFDKNEGKQNPA